MTYQCNQWEFWLTSGKSTKKSTTSLTWLFKLCCNDFCNPVYLLCQTVHKCKSSKTSGGMGDVWCNSRVAMESPYISGHFPTIRSLYYCCVVLWVLYILQHYSNPGFLFIHSLFLELLMQLFLFSFGIENI